MSMLACDFCERNRPASRRIHAVLQDGRELVRPEPAGLLCMSCYRERLEEAALLGLKLRASAVGPEGVPLPLIGPHGPQEVAEPVGEGPVTLANAYAVLSES